MVRLSESYTKTLDKLVRSYRAPTEFFENNQAKENLSRQSLRSGAFSLTAKALNVGIQVVATIALARLLLPEHFGLFAMVSALTGFAPALIDLGTQDATVQKTHISPDEISALFWLSTAIGGSLTLVVGLCAPLIASFYHEKELEQIVVIWSVVFLLSALPNQHLALLRRSLLFKRLAIIEVGANLFGAAGALGLAFLGYGYWALVFRPLLTAAMTLVSAGLACPWMPNFPRYTAGVGEMLRFGLNITAFTAIDYFSRALDRVVLGYAQGAKPLGYYQNACLAYENPLTIVNIPLHSVAVATLSKLRDNLDELKRSWENALSALCFFAMPAFAILAVTGPDVVVLLLGEKWVYAGTLLSVIALRGPAHVVERTQGWLHVAAGRSDRWMRWGIVSCIVQVAALFIGLPFGAMGIATAYTISVYLLFVPAIVYSGAPFGIGAVHLLKAVGPQLVGSVAAAGIGFLLRFEYLSDVSILERIAILVFASVSVYVFVTVGLFKIVKPLEIARSLVLDFLPPRLSGLLRRKAK
jgi:PST family polysaccharide transporter